MRRPPLSSPRALRFDRLRDPQLQVWLMAGFSLLLLLIAQVRAWNPSGEGKNEPAASASRLLLAGAQVSWTEAFGPAPQPSRRPVLQLPARPTAPLALTRQAAPVPDPRPAMEAAAARPWQFLDRPLRQRLAQLGPAAAPLHIHLTWSGDSRGNAALILHRQATAAFVIGNGSRSGDGDIAFAPNPAAGSAVAITLIGDGRAATPRQMAALGELLHHLESRSGYPIQLAATPPAAL